MAFGTIHSKGIQEQIPVNYIYSWGESDGYQALQGATTDVRIPTLYATNPWYKFIGHGYKITFIIKSNGTLWAMGINANGEAGRGNTTSPISVLTQIGTDNKWKQVCGGQYHAIAVKTDGTLWSCGQNTNYKTGLNTNAGNTTSWTQVGVATNWKQVSCGFDSSFAVKYDGTLWSWGRSAVYITGQNTTTDIQVPTQMGAATNWVKVAAWFYGGTALNSLGQIFTWGNSTSSYSTGQNTTSDIQVPTQVGADTDWSDISGYGYASGALKTNGKLYGWGAVNEHGGGNNILKVPTQIGADTDWNGLGGGYQWGWATKTNGTMYTWGGSGSYQTGQNTTTTIGTPTQLGTTTNFKSGTRYGKTLTGASFKFDKNLGWTSLASYYRLDSTSGTTAIDQIGGLNGTLSTGVTWNSSGKNNYCAAINSTTAKIELASNASYNFNRTDSFSFSFWMKRIAVSLANNAGLVVKQNPGSPYNGYAVFFSGAPNKLNFNMIASYSSSLAWIVTVNAFTSTTNWYHVVVTYDGSSSVDGMKIFVNGAQEATTASFNNLTTTVTSTQKFTLGTLGNLINPSVYMDEVAVFTRCLNFEDIRTLYNNGLGKFY